MNEDLTPHFLKDEASGRPCKKANSNDPNLMDREAEKESDEVKIGGKEKTEKKKRLYDV